MVDFGKMSHFCPPSMCSMNKNATFQKVFKTETYNLSKLLYDSLPENTTSDKIRNFRLSLNLTQLQFAKSIKRGFGTITKWEQNITVPKPSAIKDIISVYKLPENYFN